MRQEALVSHANEVAQRGMQLLREQQLEQAIECFAEVIRVFPYHTLATYGTGLAAHALGDNERALNMLKMVVQRKPDFAEGHFNYGVVLKVLGRAAEALEAFRTALALFGPGHSESYSNIGSCWQNLGIHTRALEALDSALKLNPEFHLARYNRAFSLLTLGRYREGFEDYEARWKAPHFVPELRKDIETPAWVGEKLEGRTLLIHAEQGYGDTIQFSRFISLARDLAGDGRVVFEVQKGLGRLFSEHFEGVDAVVEREADKCVHHDCHVPLMSLPRLLNVEREADLAGTFSWKWERPTVRYVPVRRVAFSWAGRASHSNDQYRSTRLNDWWRALHVPGVTFYNFQVGDLNPDADKLAAEVRPVNIGAGVKDFEDSALALRDMDLVITVDTALGHLAGTMFIPTWILLPLNNDFRWLQDREDTPWYPSVKLYRSPRLGDWVPVFERVEADLRAAAALRNNDAEDDGA